jgi:phage terminase Nu1 subunit (DNA packaging protein)
LNSTVEPLEGELPVTLERAGTLCGVTEKTIRSWIADGMPVLQAGKQGRGAKKTLVDLVAVLAWYLEQDALDAAKTRLASAQADKHEMENAVRRSELADVKDVNRVWAEMVLATRAKLLTLPTKLAAQLINVSDANLVAARVRSEVYAALEELASGTDSAGAGRSKAAAPGRRKPVASAAGADRKRMGRRKQKAEQRSVS